MPAPEELRNNGVVKYVGGAAPGGGGGADDRGAAHPQPGRPLHPGPRPVHRRRPRRAARPDPGRRPPPPGRPRRRERRGAPRPAGLRPPRPRPTRQGLRAHRLRPGRLRPGLRRARRRRPALDRRVRRRRAGRPGRGLGLRPRPRRGAGRALPRDRGRGGPRGPRPGPRPGAVRRRVRCHAPAAPPVRPGSSSASTTARSPTRPSSSRSCARRRPRSSPACSGPMSSGWPPSPTATACAPPSSRRPRTPTGPDQTARPAHPIRPRPPTRHLPARPGGTPHDCSHGDHSPGARRHRHVRVRLGRLRRRRRRRHSAACPRTSSATSPRRRASPSGCSKLRLKGLRLFGKKPMPTWGSDLSGIDFDNIKYFVRSTEKQAESWEDLPEDIKNTYDKLGIPEAEKQRLVAGVAAQYESEVVYHQIREDLEEQGVIFLDTDTALREHPELFQEYFGTVIPVGDNKFAVAEHRGVVRRLVHLRAEGRARRHPAAGLLPDQHREHGPVRADADHRRRGRLRPLRRGLHRADLQVRLAALRGRRDHREEGRPLPLHDDPELVEQRLQPGHQARRRATRARPWSGSTATSAPRSP